MSFKGAVKRAKISALRAKGFRDHEIAEELDLDPSTISYHTDQIKEQAQDDGDLIEELQSILERELGI